ncbi:MAG: UDP-N-acetylglucosamine diphosphorylase [Oscillospiraceae bacterium]|nr:UDP-N-acetylglucosamine diphosphorylase [Oscillospiraceae bacterium]
MKDLGNGILISEEAEIAKDVQILPNTQIFGKVRIGSGSVIGPNSLIEDSDIGEGTRINASQVYQSKVGNNVRIGPFSHIRPNSDIRDGVKIGDFVEIKNSVIGEKTSVAHLTYIGDSDIGARVNFGCGCVTVNYDGFNKYRTVVGDDVFVGCNTNLVAPIEVKSGSYIAAGSTLTKDVEEDALAIARARQEVKPGWAAKFRKIKGKNL